MSDLEKFRKEARQWLRDNAPKRMFEPVREAGDICGGGKKTSYPDDTLAYLGMMAERGWTAPEWPKEYGGALSREEGKALRGVMTELGLRAPLVGFGLTVIGPLLLVEGSEEQKREHLPRITRGEIRWCQGYSEPGSGSDLASLQTRAVPAGDEFVVTGQKIWTSEADKADWMFLLVRTDPDAPKHEGISFLLMDMSSPGVSVKPILLISGRSLFCETFIEDVRVPRRNLVGRLNDGWRIAKALLGFERTMISEVFNAPAPTSDRKDLLVDLARRHVGEFDGTIADPLLRDRVTQSKMDRTCLMLTTARITDAAKAGQAPGPESSILKYYGTEHNKRREELIQSILGPHALGWDGEGFERSEIEATRSWLRSRGNSIEGGTTEVQLNIIAKHVLSLPD